MCKSKTSYPLFVLLYFLMSDDDYNNLSPYEHIIRSQQFDFDYLKKLFDLTKKIKKNPIKFNKKLAGKIVALLFYEPSTRTRFSFESAANRLGAVCITTENASIFSSSAKGETIGDTAIMLNSFADVTIIRHKENVSAEKMLETTANPIINAGSGTEQHPSQALLDLFTIYEKFGRLNNLRIAVVGDLLHGRTCSSLLYLLSKFENNVFYLVSPEQLKIKDNLREWLKRHNAQFTEITDLEKILSEIDICYMTRVQKERFQNPEIYEQIKGLYILDNKKVDTMKDDAILLHPLPRTNEIPVDVDNNKRSWYFKQADNGLWVRMALLMMLKI